MDTGCLPPRYHSINRDGADLAETVGPEENTFTDDISSFAMGDLIVYKISTNNVAGDGEYSVELPVTVG